MTTARTHQTQAALGAHQSRVSAPRPDDYIPLGVDADGALVGTAVGITPPVETYDPADYTIDEVKEYVAEHPDQAEAILYAELDGKNRSGLVSWLENYEPESD